MKSQARLTSSTEDITRHVSMLPELIAEMRNFRCISWTNQAIVSALEPAEDHGLTANATWLRSCAVTGTRGCKAGVVDTRVTVKEHANNLKYDELSRMRRETKYMNLGLTSWLYNL
jgi:hypothetical protein